MPDALDERGDELSEQIATGVRNRDPDAIAACYEAYADAVFRFLRAQHADRALCEDLVEATFLELVEAAPALRGGGRGVRAWLFHAARNNLRDAVRKARRRGDLPLDEALAERQSPEPGPEELALATLRAQEVRHALQQVSPDQREVLLLRFAAGLTGPEVARMTGRTVGAVKALQHRGLAALARVLDKEQRPVGGR